MNQLQNWIIKNIHNIPRPLSGSIDHDWTEYSIAVRLPEIGKRVILENSFPSHIVANINCLIEEIPNRPIRRIKSDMFGDYSEWNTLIAPFIGQNWLEVPWFFTEFYFYRRILEATEYFSEGEFLSFDPFQFQKNEGLRSSISSIHNLLEWLQKQKQNNVEVSNTFGKLLSSILEGNRVDLSLWPVNGNSTMNSSSISMENDQMMVNDIPSLLEWIFSRNLSRLDIFIDNAGFELLGDLCMVDFLLENQVFKKVVLHVKPYPIFVSDVIVGDVEKCIKSLTEFENNNDVLMHDFRERLSRNIAEQKIIIRSDGFWAYPIPLWEMPIKLYDDLSSSDLIISKGDANYRRLLGDRRWDYQIPFSHVVSYFPSPLLAIRVIKSEIGVGYNLARFTDVVKKDPQWMKNGKWGSFQFWDGNK